MTHERSRLHTHAAGGAVQVYEQADESIPWFYFACEICGNCSPPVTEQDVATRQAIQHLLEHEG